MIYEMKLAAQSLRKEGLAPLIKRVTRYLLKLPNYLLFTLEVKRLSHYQKMELRDWVDFAFTGGGGVITPLQIRSELMDLLEFIKSRPPKHVLEIGTCNGGTLFLFSRVAADNACLISTDLPFGPYGGGYPRWKIPFYKTFAKKTQILHLIQADSHNPATKDRVKAILKNKKLDVLFIDGDHTYEGAKKDYEMYEPLVRTGGMIVFHDIVPHRKELNCGVDRYWNEIKTTKEYIECIENQQQQGAGLGVIIKAGSILDQMPRSG